MASKKRAAVQETIKIYTDWANTYLAKAEKRQVIAELQVDVCDGVLLADLITAVTGQTVPHINKQPGNTAHKLQNIAECLALLAKLGINVDALIPSEIQDGSLKGILGLFFSLSRYKQKLAGSSSNDHVSPANTASEDMLSRLPSALKPPGKSGVSAVGSSPGVARCVPSRPAATAGSALPVTGIGRGGARSAEETTSLTRGRSTLPEARRKLAPPGDNCTGRSLPSSRALKASGRSCSPQTVSSGIPVPGSRAASCGAARGASAESGHSANGHPPGGGGGQAGKGNSMLDKFKFFKDKDKGGRSGVKGKNGPPAGGAGGAKEASPTEGVDPRAAGVSKLLSWKSGGRTSKRDVSAPPAATEERAGSAMSSRTTSMSSVSSGGTGGGRRAAAHSTERLDTRPDTRLPALAKSTDRLSMRVTNRGKGDGKGVLKATPDRLTRGGPVRSSERLEASPVSTAAQTRALTAGAKKTAKVTSAVKGKTTATAAAAVATSGGSPLAKGSPLGKPAKDEARNSRDKTLASSQARTGERMASQPPCTQDRQAPAQTDTMSAGKLVNGGVPAAKAPAKVAVLIKQGGTAKLDTSGEVGRKADGSAPAAVRGIKQPMPVGVSPQKSAIQQRPLPQRPTQKACPAPQPAKTSTQPAARPAAARTEKAVPKKTAANQPADGDLNSSSSNSNKSSSSNDSVIYRGSSCDELDAPARPPPSDHIANLRQSKRAPAKVETTFDAQDASCVVQTEASDDIDDFDVDIKPMVPISRGSTPYSYLRDGPSALMRPSFHLPAAGSPGSASCRLGVSRSLLDTSRLYAPRRGARPAPQGDAFDITAGYMSDGDVLRSQQSGGEDLSSGYMSEGGATLYAKRMQQRFREGMLAVKECMAKSTGLIHDDSFDESSSVSSGELSDTINDMSTDDNVTGSSLSGNSNEHPASYATPRGTGAGGGAGGGAMSGTMTTRSLPCRASAALSTRGRHLNTSGVTDSVDNLIRAGENWRLYASGGTGRAGPRGGGDPTAGVYGYAPRLAAGMVRGGGRAAGGCIAVEDDKLTALYDADDSEAGEVKYSTLERHRRHLVSANTQTLLTGLQKADGDAKADGGGANAFSKCDATRFSLRRTSPPDSGALYHNVLSPGGRPASAVASPTGSGWLKAGGLGTGESTESMSSSIQAQIEQAKALAQASRSILQRDGQQLRRSDSFKSTRSDQAPACRPTSLPRTNSFTQLGGGAHAVNGVVSPGGSTAWPTARSLRSASPASADYSAIYMPLSSRRTPAKDDEDVHGSNSSLVSNSSSMYASPAEKKAQEIRKLRWELEAAKEKVSTLTCQLSTNAHVVVAFEQSLANMTNRLQQLTTTAEQKDSELNDLRVTIEALKHHSSIHLNPDSFAFDQMRRKSSSNASTLSKPSSTRGVLLRRPSQESISSLNSMSSLCSAASGQSSATDIERKKKKKSWLRSSFSKAFSRKKYKNGSLSDAEGDSQSLQLDLSLPCSPMMHLPHHTIASAPNSPMVSSTRLSTDSLSRDETVLELEDQLHEKDLKLTDIRLEALSSAHQLDQLRDTMTHMKNEMVSLKADNDRLQQMVTTSPTGAPPPSLLTDPLQRRLSIGDPTNIDVLLGDCTNGEGRRTLVMVNLGLPGDLDKTNEVKMTQVLVGALSACPKMKWEVLDATVRRLFKEYVMLIDPVSHLGINTESILSYKIGDIVRSRDSKYPELLPCGYLVGDTNICVTLKGTPENSVDLLAFEALVPKSIMQRYVSLLLEHRRIILCGPSGTGKTYLAEKLAQYAVIRSDKPLVSGSIATFNVDHKSSKELRQYLANVAEQCEGSGRADLPSVIILDNLHHVGSLAEVFNGFLSAKYQQCPFIIGTMNQATCSTTNLQLHHNFRWVLCANHMEPVKGFLGRYLRRKLLHRQLEGDGGTEGAGGVAPGRDAQLKRIVEWMPQVWQHVNRFLETHSSSDVTIGPRLFLSCPMDVSTSQVWFTDLWNYSIVPYLLEAVREGIQLYGRRAAWEDPLDWVLDSYPWSRVASEADWPALLKLRPEDVGYENHSSAASSAPAGGGRAKATPALQSDAESDPLLSMLMRLQEAANHSSPPSNDSDSTGLDATADRRTATGGASRGAGGTSRGAGGTSRGAGGTSAGTSAAAHTKHKGRAK